MQNRSQFNQHHVLKQRDMQETGKDSIWFDCFFLFDSTHLSYSIRWASKHDGMADIDLIFICIFGQYPFRFAPLFFFHFFPID